MSAAYRGTCTEPEHRRHKEKFRREGCRTLFPVAAASVRDGWRYLWRKKTTRSIDGVESPSSSKRGYRLDIAEA
jgi:hypothetical protein